MNHLTSIIVLAFTSGCYVSSSSLPPCFESHQSTTIVTKLLTIKDSLFCSVSTDNNYKIEWYRDDTVLTSNDNFYLINYNHLNFNHSHSSSQNNHNGVYHCTVANDKGVVRSENYNVSFITGVNGCRPVTETVSLNTFESLNVEKYGGIESEGVVYEWERGDKVVSENKRYYIDVNDDLHIGYVTSDDNGVKLTNYLTVREARFGCKYIMLSVTQGGMEGVTRMVHRSPPHVVALLGATVALECFVNAGNSQSPITYMAWRRQDSSNHIFQPEYSPHRWRITLKDLKKEDEGVYVCSYAGVNASISLTLHQAPTFKTSSNHPQNTNVTWGDDVIIPCDVQALPPPSIHWFINEVAITENEPRISLSKNGKEMFVRGVCGDCSMGGDVGGSDVGGTGRSGDSMVVRCEGRNMYGVVSASGYLNVLMKTSVKLLTRTTTYTVELPTSKGEVVFECSIQHDPITPASIRWSSFVGDNHHGEILVSDEGGMVVDGARLSFKVPNNASKSWNQYKGEYVCSGNNGYSNESVHVWVKVRHMSAASASLERQWLMILLATLIIFFFILVIFFLFLYTRYNKETSYHVDKHERKNGNNPLEEVKHDMFIAYTRQDLKGSKRTLCSVDEDDEDDDDDGGSG